MEKNGEKESGPWAWKLLSATNKSIGKFSDLTFTLLQEDKAVLAEIDIHFQRVHSHSWSSITKKQDSNCDSFTQYIGFLLLSWSLGMPASIN